MPKRIFIGSAPDDISHVATLKKYLKLYERQNLIQVWDEGQINAGDLRQNRIEQELHNAEIILLLFTANLVAEDFIWGTPMNQVLEKVRRREVQLIPILVSPCPFSDTPFAAYAAVPERNKPISSYNNKDEAWNLVVEQIKRSILQTPSASPEPSTHTIAVGTPSQSVQSTVNDLIASGKAEEALNTLQAWAKDHNQDAIKDDVILLKSRWSSLKRQERLGMISFSEANIENNKIVNSIIGLSNSIEEL